MGVRPGILLNRPIRCCNPGSLDFHPEFTTWSLDLATPPHDTNLDGSPGRVARFLSPEHGTKRLAIQVIRYLLPEDQGGHGWDTIRTYVANYCPNSDPKAHNNESEYRAGLIKRLGLQPMKVLPPRSLTQSEEDALGQGQEVRFTQGHQQVTALQDGTFVIAAADRKLNVTQHLVPLVHGIAHQETGHELEAIWDDPDFVTNGIHQALQRFGMA